MCEYVRKKKAGKPPELFFFGFLARFYYSAGGIRDISSGLSLLLLCPNVTTSCQHRNTDKKPSSTTVSVVKYQLKCTK